jgi:hypothetical protein
MRIQFVSTRYYLRMTTKVKTCCNLHVNVYDTIKITALTEEILVFSTAKFTRSL